MVGEQVEDVASDVLRGVAVNDVPFLRQNAPCAQEVWRGGLYGNESLGGFHFEWSPGRRLVVREGRSLAAAFLRLSGPLVKVACLFG